MNVSSWLNKAIKNQQLERLDAELILASVLGRERVFLHAHPDFDLSHEQLEKADSMAERRAQQEPLAYILGYKDFYGRRFKVNKNVLIPRPETEALVNAIKNYSKVIPAHRNLKILDVGTGSGCIITTLACELKDRELSLTATDISSAALECAQYNAKALTNKSISLIKSNLLKSKALKGQKFDIIVANLPYVDKDWPWLEKKTLDYEPKIALYAPDYGLALIKKLLLQAPNFLEDDGIMVLEADLAQHDEILDFCISNEMNFQPLGGDLRGAASATKKAPSDINVDTTQCVTGLALLLSKTK